MSETPELLAGDGDFLAAPRHPVFRVLDALTTVLNAIGTLLIVGVMLAINLDVLSRSLFGQPVSGVPEIVSMSIVAIVFLQIGHSLRVGGLTRAEILLDRLPLRVRAGLEAFYCLVGAGLCVVLFQGVVPLFERAWTRNVFVGAIGDFTAPTWPVRLIVLIGIVALGLQFLARAARAMWVAADGSAARPREAS